MPYRLFALMQLKKQIEAFATPIRFAPATHSQQVTHSKIVPKEDAVVDASLPDDPEFASLLRDAQLVHGDDSRVDSLLRFDVLSG